MSDGESTVRALILSRDHRVLLVSREGGWSVPQTHLARGRRALQAITEFAAEQLRLALPAAIGSRMGAEVVLAFVVKDATSVAPDTRWVRLPEAAQNPWVWSAYVELILGGFEPPSRALDVFAFGAGEEMAARLAHLVVCGAKRGTALWLRAAVLDGSTIPEPGLVSVVTDGFGLPRCVIETLHVERLRLCDVTAEHAQIEAEGDRTLGDFYDGHMDCFSREAAQHGLTFDDKEELLFERFRVLRVLGKP